jgi:NADH dehydrogenase FAD-containing subunit
MHVEGQHTYVKTYISFRLCLSLFTCTLHFILFLLSFSTHTVLASAAVGTVEYRSMTEAVRAANPMIERYIEGSAVDINVEQKFVTVQLESLLEDYREGLPPQVEIAYDKLVVAVGCKVADTIVPGAAEYCSKLKSCEDARRLRNAIGECLEFASRCDVTDQKVLTEQDREWRTRERRRRVTFCIVGGGPTGVELAGELVDFVKDITKPRVGSYTSLKDDIRIVIVQGAPDLVPQFDPHLRKHAAEALRREGVEVRLNTRVLEVGDGFIRLAPKDTGVEEVLQTGVTVWAAGTAPVPFISKLLDKLPPEARGQAGKVQVDPWLRCPTPTPETFGSIFILGDAAHCSDGYGNHLAQTAQVAGQQGAFLSRILNRGYDLTVTPPRLLPQDSLSHAWYSYRHLENAPGFDFLNLGILAYIGSGEALSQIQIGHTPIASYAGSISFILWRGVYLVKQVATRNRVLVTFDWFKCRVFGRDITRL